MQSSLSTKQINRFITRMLHRYHIIIFSVIALGGVIAATLVLNGVVIASEPQKIETPYASFDRSTIEALSSLNTSTSEAQIPPIDTLRGTRNPFTE